MEDVDAPAVGTNIHLTIATLGAWSARVGESLRTGFAADVEGTPTEIVKLGLRLSWLKRLQNRETRNRRIHQRFALPPLAIELRREDGILVPATLIDLSCSGAGVRVSSRLPLGTPVAVNGISGHVVRCFDGGVGIRFSDLYSLDDLKQRLVAQSER